MVVGAGIVAAYTAWALRQTGTEATGQRDLKHWALGMLVFIGIGVGAMILAHIALAASLGAKDPGRSGAKIDQAVAASMVEDEMDKLIALKSGHIGYITVGLGFVLVLATLALGASGVVGLHIAAGSFAIGGLAEGAAALWLYERGVHHA
jgi:hypothetical protein